MYVYLGPGEVARSHEGLAKVAAKNKRSVERKHLMLAVPLAGRHEISTERSLAMMAAEDGDLQRQTKP